MAGTRDGSPFHGTRVIGLDVPAVERGVLVTARAVAQKTEKKLPSSLRSNSRIALPSIQAMWVAEDCD